jgi:hypothetical protein
VKRVHVLAARNEKRVADVEPRPGGLFAFHYYSAADQGVLLRLWDQLVGWYEKETALANGTLLVPADGERSDYLAIDHARWDVGLAKLLWQQLSKESFWRVIRPSIEDHRVGAMPILYRLA